MKQLRALLHGAARGFTNLAVRTTLHCATIRPRLQVRRIAWLKSISTDLPHQVFLAVLTGTSTRGLPQLQDKRLCET
eukprot:6845994-Heterocapsa_arctica.AAC.1